MIVTQFERTGPLQAATLGLTLAAQSACAPRSSSNSVRHSPTAMPRRGGQRVSTAFMESAVIQPIDMRMSKSQQMRWSLIRWAPIVSCRCVQKWLTVALVMRSVDGIQQTSVIINLCQVAA